MKYNRNAYEIYMTLSTSSVSNRVVKPRLPNLPGRRNPIVDPLIAYRLVSPDLKKGSNSLHQLLLNVPSWKSSLKSRNDCTTFHLFLKEAQRNMANMSYAGKRVKRLTTGACFVGPATTTTTSRTTATTHADVETNTGRNFRPTIHVTLQHTFILRVARKILTKLNLASASSGLLMLDLRRETETVYEHDAFTSVKSPTMQSTSNSASNFELFECKQSEDKTPSVSFSKDRLRPLVYDQLIKKNKTCSETKCENQLRGLHARSNSENQRSYLDDIEEASKQAYYKLDVVTIDKQSIVPKQNKQSFYTTSCEERNCLNTKLSFIGGDVYA
uniref:Uncharacterized protein n=1 Tax=Glossina austeni TaxID=7395 RepID=A0A1A9VP56_GLOAU